MTGATASMPWWIGTLVLLAFLAPGTMIWAGLRRSQREDVRDILEHGVPAIGTIVGIRNFPIRGGRQWIVTLEFAAPDHPEPVRFEAVMVGSFNSTPKPLRNVLEGQSVALHYRKKWPSLAVVDEFVR